MVLVPLSDENCTLTPTTWSSAACASARQRAAIWDPTHAAPRPHAAATYGKIQQLSTQVQDMKKKFVFLFYFQGTKLQVMRPQFRLKESTNKKINACGGSSMYDSYAHVAEATFNHQKSWPWKRGYFGNHKVISYHLQLTRGAQPSGQLSL